MSNKKCSTCRREFPIEDYVGEKQQTTTTCKLCREKYKKPKCAAKDRNNNPCRANAIPDKNFCKNHEYMCEYTDEMLTCVELCSGCKKMYFLDGYKICKKCRERGEETRENAREKIVLCAHEGCTFKRTKENEFCGHHQLQQFVKETIESGKKVCFNHIRGCRQQLDIEYKYSKCSECLKVDREKDKNRRNKIIEEVKIQNLKKCSQCKKDFNEEEFIGDKQQQTKRCKTCREKDKTRIRDVERRRELAREASKKPENVEKKKKWKEENKEKVAMIWMNHRQKKIENDGVENYLKQNAEQAKKWRENNPQKMEELKEKRKNDVNYHYKIYLRSSVFKNLEFQLSIEQFNNIVKEPCYYCGIIQERGFNGIDRKNQSLGYIIDNCCSCCKMCNYMKTSLSDEVFLKRVEHILTYNKIIHGNLYPEIFANHNSVSYSSYKSRANNKNIEFLITKEEYDDITLGKCYICGKEKTEIHTNGIDRFDNNIGYIIENCRSCCGECNYMKKHYPYDDIIKKFIKINENHSRISFQKVENNIIQETNISSIVKTNKKSKEELKKDAIERTNRKKEELIKRYNDEEYKKMRAKEISEKTL